MNLKFHKNNTSQAHLLTKIHKFTQSYIKMYDFHKILKFYSINLEFHKNLP